MTHDEMLAIREQADVELRKTYPGVQGVGIGYRTRGGQMTDEITLIVNVTQKRPLAELAPDEVIPSSYQGLAIDVLTVPEVIKIANDQCVNHQQYDPLLGGINVSSMKPLPGNTTSRGTLGFFVTLNGETAPRNIGLVTCSHVVTEGGAGVNDTFYEPAWLQVAGGSWAIVSLSSGDPAHSAKSIGPVYKITGEHDDSNGFYLDAATIKLDFCISSCCHSNCGISFKPSVILGLNINGSDHITDVGPTDGVKVGDTVYKVGATTARTVGRVSKIKTPVGSAHQVIEITPVSMNDASNCGGVLRFAQSGDSGSALIDASGKLIGLVFAVDAATQTLGYACYVQPLLTALGAVAITAATPVQNNPAAEGTRVEIPAFIDGVPNMTPRLRARVLASEHGRYLWRVVDQHRLEAQRLVNRNRRVTVAWHRHKGPQFLNRVIANARDPDQLIPREIEGVTREALLRAMAAAFRDHGSPALRAAVEGHAGEALALLGAGDDLHQLVELLIDRKSA